jgi:hypothetical protein
VLGFIGGVLTVIEFSPGVLAKIMCGLGLADPPRGPTAEGLPIVGPAGGAVSLRQIQEDPEDLYLDDEENLLRDTMGNLRSGGRLSAASAARTLSAAGAAAGEARVTAASVTSMLVAWLALVFSTSLGLVMITYFERHAGLNMFGYAAQDQILLPVTTIPVLWLINAIPALRAVLDGPDVPDQSFRDLCAQTWSEFSWTTMGIFRGLSFGREFIFFFLATSYALAQVYMELTLLRIALSWVSGVLVLSFAPRFIAASQAEKEKIFDPCNFAVKLIATAFVTLALIFLHT